MSGSRIAMRRKCCAVRDGSPLALSFKTSGVPSDTTTSNDLQVFSSC